MKVQRPLTLVSIQKYICLWNTLPLATTKSKKLFLAKRLKSRSQGHLPWYINWKGIIRWVCMPNMKYLSLTIHKLWPRVKFYCHRHRQDKNEIFQPQFWGHKKLRTTCLNLFSINISLKLSSMKECIQDNTTYFIYDDDNKREYGKLNMCFHSFHP